MRESEPYLSVVVTARNDDHGGDLLRRMQAFVNGWIGQSTRHGLSSELLVVDWNPPEDRPPLLEALRWPHATGPCQVRFIQVPPALHRKYEHAEALPLYQMIAKNVGIRRARGRFVLVTNIDILFSDQLIRFLAEGRLESGRMYRMDRHDIMSDVPVDGTVDEQLAYCESHLIRVNAREGTFPIADGRRVADGDDISAPDSGIHFGAGWYAPERNSPTEVFRWVNQDAEMTVCLPNQPPPALLFDVQPGPGVGGRAFVLQVLDTAGAVLAETWIRGRSELRLQLPADTETVKTIFLRALGGGLPITEDLRILNFRVYRCRWASDAASSEQNTLAGDAALQETEGLPQTETVLTAQPQILSGRTAGLWARWTNVVRVIGEAAPEKPLLLPVPRLIRKMAQAYCAGGLGGVLGQLLNLPGTRRRLLRNCASSGDIFQAGSGLRGGQGWYDLEHFRGETFRWIRNDAELIVCCPEGSPRLLEVYVEPGPGLEWKPFQLTIRDGAGQPVTSVLVKKLQKLKIPIPWQPGRTRILSLHIEGGGRPCPTDPRLLNFRLFGCRWAGLPDQSAAPALESAPAIPIETGLALGTGWNRAVDEAGQPFVESRGAAEILIRSGEVELPRLVRLEAAIDSPDAVPFEVQDESGKEVACGRLRGRRVCHLALPVAPGKTGVFSLRAASTVLRLYRLGWSDAQVDITELASGLKTISGWSPVHVHGADIHRLIERSAELEVTIPQGSGMRLQLDLAAHDRGPVTASILDRHGSTVASFAVDTRNSVAIDLAGEPGTRELLQIVAPGVRVYHCGWSGTPETAARRFKCEGEMAGPGQDVLALDSPLTLGKGWHAPESADSGTYRWASSFAELAIASDTRPVSLIIDIEAGPSLQAPDFNLQVLDETWACVFETAVTGRRTVRVDLRQRFDGRQTYRLSVTGGGLPLVSDPRILDFRVFRLEAEYTGPSAYDKVERATKIDASNGARPRLLPQSSPSRSIPLHLHTNACGDFTLMALEHWLDLRGYPEFDMYSFHIDSVLCYTAHHAGVQETILGEPMRIYHIEHGLGSGWTPEGQARLFGRLRAKRIPYIEYQELVGWAVQMRKLNCPFIFNRENWGLGDLSLPEMHLPDQQIQAQAIP